MVDPKLCIVKTKGGMGNRMLCAASGILWARAAGRRCFVDWRDDAYSHDGENSLFHFFAPPHAVEVQGGFDPDSVEPEIWRGRTEVSVSKLFHSIDPGEHRSITAHKRYSIDPRRADQASDAVVFWHYMDQIGVSAPLIRASLPEYKGMAYLEILSKAIREELPLRTELSDRVGSIADGWGGRPMIGVHIRYSDRKAPVAKCEQGVRRMRKKFPDAGIFLATDSREIERDFASKFGTVFITDKWLPEPGEAAHQNPNCDDPVANGMEALLDMYLLARCDALVYARRSTFSFVSHCLGEFSPGAVLDVDAGNPSVLARRLLRRVVA